MARRDALTDHAPHGHEPDTLEPRSFSESYNNDMGARRRQAENEYLQVCASRQGLHSVLCGCCRWRPGRVVRGTEAGLLWGCACATIVAGKAEIGGVECRGDDK